MNRKNVALMIKTFLLAFLSVAIVIVSFVQTNQIAFAAENENLTEELGANNSDNNETSGTTETVTETVTETAAPAEVTAPAEEAPAEEAEDEEAPEEETAPEEEAPVVTDPVAPTKPQIEGEVNNTKINQYNSEVDNYNSQVDAYNKAVDDKYEADLADVARQNEEIERNNELEQQKVLEAEQQNEEIRAKYAEDYAQYEKDQEKADYVVSRYNGRFATIEDYNNWVVNDYNNPALRSAEENAKETNAFNVSNTYLVEEAEEKSGNKVTVRIVHNFIGYGEFSEEVEIDENDVITLYAAAAHLQTTNPGYCQFYMQTDDNHAMGYWSEAWSELMDTANNKEWGWDCGDKHTLTYRDGKLHPSDSTDVDIIYNYNWTPLKTYGLYNVPNKPELNLVEYTPNILSKLEAPSKMDYLTYLTYMDLLKDIVVPTPTPDPTPDTDDEPDVVPPAPVVIAETPVALAPAPEAQVLGATRQAAPAAAVLGARRGSTDDNANTSARVIMMIIAGAAIVVVISARRKSMN